MLPARLLRRYPVDQMLVPFSFAHRYQSTPYRECNSDEIHSVPRVRGLLPESLHMTASQQITQSRKTHSHNLIFPI